MEPETTVYVHDVAVVVPVYRGEQTIRALVDEIRPLTESAVTPGGHRFVVTEVVLVHDCGPDRSAAVMRELASECPLVKPVWLSRNFGQHAATLAGIASSAATWVVTMDEDGQHAPGDIAVLLDAALASGAELVYGHHEAGAPHPWWRNAASSAARRLARWLAGSSLDSFSSFRLVLGTHARAVAAYCGPRIYLDLALTWAIGSSTSALVSTRPEWRSGSGYSIGRLMSHFWTLVLTSGTRPLRIVSGVGFLVALLGAVGAVAIAVARLNGSFDIAGWASVIVTLLCTNGLIIFTLGVVAEYIGALLLTAQGRPLYIVVDDPSDGPLSGRPRATGT